MSAPTPGPWVAAGLSRLEFVEKDIGGTRMTVATCFQQGAMSDGECSANAKLIAAAPDLLAAAKNAVDYCCGNPETRASDEPCSSCGPLIAAIAKAEGQS